MPGHGRITGLSFPIQHHSGYFVVKTLGIEVDYSWLLMGENDWKYCFVICGLSLFFIDFGNPEVLGNSLSLYAFIEPLIGAQAAFTERCGLESGLPTSIMCTIDG
jgi:hypothetical protein